MMLLMVFDYVVYFGMFLKVFVLGLWIGYIIVFEEFYFKFVQVKQVIDLYMLMFMQCIVYEVIKDGFFDEYILMICVFYSVQCDVMFGVFVCYMLEGVMWNCLEGGMFIWVNLFVQIDSMKLFVVVVDNYVVFVLGVLFFVENVQQNMLCLLFVMVLFEKIEEGVVCFGKLLCECF